MTTMTQFLANRRNAQRSTGPKTPAGKTRSSQNAVQHGLRASEIITVLESTVEFQILQAALFEEWKPRSLTEEIEVGRLARVIWQRNRAERALNELLNSEICSAIESRAERDPGTNHFVLDVVKKKLRKNSVGIGSALCRLSGNGDKLSTAMRYMAQWERAAERSVQTLRRLKGGEDR